MILKPLNRMDASDIIRRNLQVTQATAKVSAIKVNRPSFIANTTNNSIKVGPMTFPSSDDKLIFDSGMKYLSFSNDIPTVSTMQFCALRTD